MSQLGMQKKQEQDHEHFIKVTLTSTFFIEHVRGDDGKRAEGIGIHLLKVKPNIGIILTANLCGHVSIFGLPHGQKLAQVGRDPLPGEYLIAPRKLKPYFRDEYKRYDQDN